MCGVQPWCVLKGTRILLLGGVLSKCLPGPTGRWRRSHPDLHWFSVRLSYRFLLPLVDLSAPSCCMCLKGQLLGAEVTKIVVSSLWIYHYKVPFFIPVNSPYSEAALFVVNKVTAAFFWRALAWCTVSFFAHSHFRSSSHRRHVSAGGIQLGHVLSESTASPSSLWCSDNTFNVIVDAVRSTSTILLYGFHLSRLLLVSLVLTFASRGIEYLYVVLFLSSIGWLATTLM